jgi:hypothetical protein
MNEFPCMLMARSHKNKVEYKNVFGGVTIYYPT